MSLALFLLVAGAPDPCQAHPASQRDLIRCAVAKKEAADAELAALLARAERQMCARDEAGGANDGHLALFRAGQTAWASYRDAQCRLEGFNMRGGSGQPLIENLCLGRMDRARAAEVRNVLGQEDR